jgi:arabinofuranan 3-O-arabinosyltransferase
LTAGTHQFEAKPSKAPFQVTSAVLRQPATATAAPAASPRKATIAHWANDSRSIKVSAGPATYLAVAQNYNKAWVASLGHKTLKSVRLDGWQQGYLVPAGPAGTITMSMSAQSSFSLVLVLGAVFLLVLLALALVPSRRRILEPIEPRSPPAAWFLFAASVVILALIGGPLALVLVPLAFIGRRWGNGVLAGIAFVAFVVAGIAAAWHPAALNAAGADAFGRQAQIASVIALAAVLAALALPGRVRRKRAVAEADVAAVRTTDDHTPDDQTDDRTDDRATEVGDTQTDDREGASAGMNL